MMHKVKRINYIEGYTISLTFNDNTTKIVDLKRYLDKGIFLALRDPDYFNRVYLCGSTIAWPNDADFCPNVLYRIGKAEKSNLKRAPKRRHNHIVST